MYDAGDRCTSAFEGDQPPAEVRELAAALERALRIDPLPAPLELRIQRDFDRVRVPAVRPWSLRLMRTGGLAAAAALLVATLIPRPADTDRPALVVTHEEVQVIAYVLGELKWPDPLEAAIDRLSRWVATVDRALLDGADGESFLPWSPSDDWDRPREDDTDTQRSQRRSSRAAEVAKMLPGAASPEPRAWRIAHV